jgi:hypothetical protein
MYNPKEYWSKRLEENFSLSGVGFTSFGRNYTCRNKYINHGVRLVLTVMEKIPYLNEMPIFDHMYSYYKILEEYETK